MAKFHFMVPFDLLLLLVLVLLCIGPPLTMLLLLLRVLLLLLLRKEHLPGLSPPFQFRWPCYLGRAKRVSHMVNACG